MEEDIKLLKEMQNNCIKSMLKGAIYTDEKAERKSLAIENILNELDRLQKENTLLKNENEALQMTHEYDVRMIDEVKGEYVKLSKEFEAVDHECSRLERKEIILESENEHYKDLIYALETYYSITEKDLEKVLNEGE